MASEVARTQNPSRLECQIEAVRRIHERTPGGDRSHREVDARLYGRVARRRQRQIAGAKAAYPPRARTCPSP